MLSWGVMARFVNRSSELALLERIAASDRRELLVVYGRRRLGKRPCSADSPPGGGWRSFRAR